MISASSLAPRLDNLYRTFDHVTSATDPVHIVRRYESPEDREVVGFCAAGLAFGRVASVLNSIESLLAVMGPRPAAFVRSFDPVRSGAALAPIGHRWIRGKDLIALMLILRRMLDECVSAARHAGKMPRPQALDTTTKTLTQAGSTFTASMLRDLESGGRTEAAHVVGDMLARARAAGGDTTMLQAAWVHLQARDARQKREGNI